MHDLLPGCLEGLEHTADLVARQRQTFTEQTQEDLYMATHAGKSASKKGLGSSTAPSVPHCPPLVPTCPSLRHSQAMWQTRVALVPFL